MIIQLLKDKLGSIGNHKTLVFLVALLFLLLLFSGAFFTLSAKGYTPLNYNAMDISIVVNKSMNYTWRPDKEGLLTSLKIDGRISPSGLVKIYLIHENTRYLLFDSSKILNAHEITGTKQADAGISIKLEYKNSTPYDEDNNGIANSDEVIDFTVENTEIDPALDEDYLCTRYMVYLVEPDSSRFVCYGNELCCSFLDLPSSIDSWKHPFYLVDGSFGIGQNIVVSAQVAYIDYNLSLENPYSEIYYSDWAGLSAHFSDGTIMFEESCLETCDLPEINSPEYTLAIEVERASLYLDTLRYTLLESSNIHRTRFDRKLSCNYCDPAAQAVNPLTDVNVTINFSLPAPMNNIKLMEYYPATWKLINSGSGKYFPYNDTYAVLQWDFDKTSYRESRTYALQSPKDSGPYYFQSALQGVKGPVYVIHVSDNKPPGCKNIPNISIVKNTDLILNLDNYCHDPDNDNFQYNFKSSNGVNITVNGSLIYLKPYPDFLGTKAVSFTVNDKYHNPGKYNLFLDVSESPIISKDNLTEEIKQFSAEIGSHVKWVRKFRYKTEKNIYSMLNLSLPQEASKIEVKDSQKPVDKNQFFIVKPKNDIKKNPFKFIFQFRKDTDSAKSRITSPMNLLVPALISNDTYLEVRYETPAPTKVEAIPVIQDHKWRKNVTIQSSASMHYHDILSYSNIPETRHNHVKLIWILNDTRIDVTSDQRFKVRLGDKDMDGKADILFWHVPQLSQQDFEILVSLMDLRVISGTPKHNWSIYFNSSAHSAQLTAKLLSDGSDISFKDILYYDEGDSSWQAYTDQYSVAGSNLSTTWNGSKHTRGRIIYDINNLGRFKVNMTFGNISVIAENYDYYNQVEPFLLNLTKPIFTFDLCSFNHTYWECNPSSTDLGSEGEDITINSSAIIRYFTIPGNSTILSVNLSIESRTNASIQSYSYQDLFSSTSIASGSLTNNTLSEIAIASGSLVTAKNSSNDMLWNYSASDTINDIGIGNVDSSSPNSEVVIVADQFLKVLSSTGSQIRNITNNIVKLAIGRIVEKVTLSSQDDSSADDLACIGCSGYMQRFTIPYSLGNFSDSLCYVIAPFNYKENRSGSLTFSLNDTVYDISEDDITVTNVLNYNSTDGSSEDVSCIGCSSSEQLGFNLWFEIPSLIPAEDCYVSAAMNYRGNKTGNLSLEINSTIYDIDESQITAANNHTQYIKDDSSADDLACIGCSGYMQRFTIPYSFGNFSDSICSVKALINYNENSSGNLTFSLNGSIYDINEGDITISNKLNYNSTDNNADDFSCVGCTDYEQQRFNLWYDIPSPVPAKECYVKAAFNYKGNTTGNLTFSLNGTTYSIDESQINTSNLIQYKINGSDNTAEESDCIGCNLDQVTFIMGFNIPSTIPAKDCYVNFGACYNGSNKGVLSMTITDGGGTYYPNVSTSCEDNNWSWVYTPVPCSLLVQNRSVQIACSSGCNSTDHYRIMGDNSTNTSDSIYFDGFDTVYPDYDYMIQVFSNTSLLFDWTDTLVSCADVVNNTNITFICDDCDDEHRYHISSDTSSENHSYYYNGSEWNLVGGNDHIVIIHANSSLLSSTITTIVECLDLAAGQNITFNCSSCGSNYYNILLDSSVSGDSSYFNGTEWLSINKNHMVSIIEDTKLFSHTYTLVACADVSQYGNVTFSCTGCNESNNYGLIKDSSSNGHSYLYDGSLWSTIGGYDFYVRMFSNTSLLSSWVSTEVNCSDLAIGQNITFNCSSCGSNYYNILLDSSISGNSSYFNGSDWIMHDNEHMVRIKTLQVGVNDIITADGFDNIIIYNSTLTQVWNYSIGSDIYDIWADDMHSGHEGNELLVGALGKAILLNSSGSMIWENNFGGNKVEGVCLSPDKKAVIGLNNGYIYQCDTGGTCTQMYEAGSGINDLIVDDLTSSSGYEILATLSDGHLLLLNSSFSSISSAALSSALSFIETGNLHTYSGTEALVIGSDNLVYVMNLQDPGSIVIGAGNNGYAWNKSGLLTNQEFVNGSSLIDSMNEFLANCTEKSCNVPFNLSAGIAGRMRFRQPVIRLQYNASNEIAANDNAVRWSRTDEIEVNSELYYLALNISYPGIPPLPLHIRFIQSENLSINYSSWFNSAYCNYSGSQLDLGYTLDDGSSFGCDADYYISDSFARNPDYWWHNLSAADRPILMSHTTYLEDNFYKYNATIARNTNYTAQIFTSIIANISINESLIFNNLKFEVDWFSNGSYYDITPANGTDNCNSSIPTYSSFHVGSYAFSVCKQDTDNNGMIDYIKWKQPILKPMGQNFSNISYRISDSAIETLNLSFLNDSQIINRGSQHILIARLINDEGEFRNYSGQNCSWYLNDENIGNSTTANGTCSIVWNTSCGTSFLPAGYTVRIELYANNSFLTNNFTGSVDLVDILDIEMTYPNGSIQVDYQDIISLTSIVNDSCGAIDPSLADYVKWMDNYGWSNTGVNTSYYVSRETGQIQLTEYINYHYYINSTNATGFLQLDDVIKISLITTDPIYRTNASLAGENITLQAQIYTGDDIPINSSALNDSNNWANYTCEWYVDNIFTGRSNTSESDGVCEFKWNTSCSAHELGSHTFRVDMLSHPDFNYNFSAGGNTSTRDINLMDANVSVYILSPGNNSLVYYTDTINLNVTVNDSCGCSNQSYITTWNYVDSDNPDMNLGTITSWYVASYAYGSANLTAQVTYAYYDPASSMVDIQAWRKARLVELDVTAYPPSDSLVDVICSVNISGISNKSNYNITFYIDRNTSNPLVVKTNSSGKALYQWNTTGFPKGPHYIGCNISEDDTKYFIAEAGMGGLETTVIIPTKLIISASFVDSRELNLATCGHYIPSTFVFRTASETWQEPDLLFLGANVSTTWNSTGEGYLMDNVTVHFNVVNDLNISVDEVTCLTNITEFENRGENPPTHASENLCDHYYNDYVCYTNWDVPLNVPVGSYRILINASYGEGWTSNTIEVNISVYGILNLTINQSLETEWAWTDGNMSLTANVMDDAGNNLSYDNVTVKWYIYDQVFCTSFNDDTYLGNGSGGSHFYNWIVWSHPQMDDPTKIETDWGITATVYGDYYGNDSYHTQYNPEDSSCEDFDYRTHWDVVNPELYHKSTVTLTIPSNDVTEMDDSGLVNFTCRVTRTLDSNAVDDGFPVYFICDDCNVSENLALRNTTTDVNGETVFTLNFTDEYTGLNAYYNFTCMYYNYSWFRLAQAIDGNHTRKIRIVSHLGGGEGECDYDCDESGCNDDPTPCDSGETCISCPYDCHFINGTTTNSNNDYDYSPYIGETYLTTNVGCGCNNEGFGNCQQQYENNSCGDCYIVNQNRTPNVINATSSMYVAANNTLITISVKAKDDDNDLQIVWLMDNITGTNYGQMNTSEGGSAVNYRTYASSSINIISNMTFRIYANDSLSNINDTETVIIYMDPILPVVYSFFANDTDNISNYALDLVFTVYAHDNDSFSGNISFASINGSSMQLFSGDEWRLTANLSSLGCTSEGNCTLTAIAGDDAGNNNSLNYIVIVDNTNPSVSSLVSNDPDNITRYDVQLNFTVNVSDNDGIEGNVSSVLISNTSMTSAAGDIWYAFINATSLGCAAEGACTITAAATDSAGNQNSTNYTLYIDHTNPSVHSFISNVSTNLSTSDAIINFTVNATDDDSIQGSVFLVAINGTNMTLEGDFWTLAINLTSLGCSSEGNCILTAKATDYANNSAYMNYTIVMDDGLVSILNNSLSSIVFDPSPSFNITTSEAANCSYRIDNGQYSTMQTTGSLFHSQQMPAQSLNYTYISTGKYHYIQHYNYMDGNHTLTINCTELSGRSNATSYNFTVKSPVRNRVFYEEDTLVRLNMTFEKSLLNVSVNFSNIDSGYNDTHKESVTDFGNGIYIVEYNISASNTRTSAQYKLHVIAADNGTQTVNTSLYLTYIQSSDWTFDIVNDAITCRSGSPGWYFDEINCNWNSDVNFAGKKYGGSPLEDDCEDNVDNDGEDGADCADTDCAGILYKCRNNAGIDSAVWLDDPCENNLCHVLSSVMGGTDVYFTESVRPGQKLKVLFSQDGLSGNSVLVQINNIPENFSVTESTTTISDNLSTKVVTSTALTARTVSPETFTGDLRELLSVQIPDNNGFEGQYKIVTVLRSIDDGGGQPESIFNFSINSSAIINESDYREMINGYNVSVYCNDTLDNDLNWRYDCSNNSGTWDLSCNSTYVSFDGGIGICQLGEESNCSDGFDNDRDGLADCQDQDCDGKVGNATSGKTCSFNREALYGEVLKCSDGFDNDGRNSYDCEVSAGGGIDDAEYDCAATCKTWLGTPTTESICNDSIDNDLDAYYPSTSDTSAYGYIQNNSGGYDCRYSGYDIDCNNTVVSFGGLSGVCQIGFELNCTDGFDNDRDNGYTSDPGFDSSGADCDDYNCYEVTNSSGHFICTENYGNTAAPQEVTCNDSIDNDLDGNFDCADSDCNGLTGPNGTCVVSENFSINFGAYCEDDFDNDGDDPDGDVYYSGGGGTDCEDSGCYQQFGNCRPCAAVENITIDSCADGLDNDYDSTQADSYMDCSDTDCAGKIGSGGQICEPGGETTCNDGMDNDGDGLVDCLDSNCSCYTKEDGPGMCKDSIDNDHDGTTDCQDIDCKNTTYCAANDQTYSSFAEITIGDVSVSYNDVIRQGENITLYYYAAGLSSDSVLIYAGTSTYPISQFVDSPYSDNTFQAYSGDQSVGFVKSSNANSFQSEDLSITGWFNLSHKLFVSRTASLDNYTIEIYTSIDQVATKSISIMVLENETPSINITAPLTAAVINRSYVTVEANSSDLGTYNSGIDHCEFKIDSGSWITDNDCIYTFSSVSDGQHTIYAKSVDGSGNTAPQDSITITVNNSGSTDFNVSQHYYNSIQQSNISATFVSAAGYQTNASGCIVKVRNVNNVEQEIGKIALTSIGATTANCNGTINFTSVAYDYYDISIEVNDTSNKLTVSDTDYLWLCEYKNTSQGVLTCKDICEQDSTPPNITSVQINDSIVKSDAWIVASVNVSDESSATIQTVTAESQSLSWNGIIWTGTIQIDNDGYINVTVTDRADLIDTDNNTQYTIDDILPQIYNFTSSEADNITRSDAYLNFTLNANDTHLRTVILNGSSMINDSGKKWWNYTTPASLNCNIDGQCILTAIAYDDADNQNTTSYTLIIDDSEPSIGFAGGTALNGSYFNRDWIYVNVSASDDNELNIIFYLSNESDLVNTTTLSAGSRDINFTNLDPNSVYYYNVTMVDKAGNSNSSLTRVLTLDSMGPGVANPSVNYSDFIVKKSDDIIINVTVTGDNIDSVNVSNASMIEMSRIGSTDVWQVTTTPSSLGCTQVNSNCTLHFAAADKSGNQNNSVRLDIIIDDLPPSIDFAGGTGSDNSFFNRNWIFVNVTALDTNEDSIVFSLFNQSGIVNSTALSAGTRSINFTNLNPDAAYFYNVTISDLAGNDNSTATRQITLDSINPSIYRLISNDTDNVSRSDIHLNFSVIANDSNILSVELNSTNMAQNGDEWTALNTSAQFGCNTDGNCTLTAI
ncbi:MAG: hypothetical protein KAK00_09400, partial [Nanoarchaeota archaeon]|nr:hypothetical protein [Nanoarchaeota archaeon]